jgi:RNA-directed DNA polymerase
MTKGQEQSDRCVVPMKGGNAPGGKAATASEGVMQLSLLDETADSPQGVAGAKKSDRSGRRRSVMPKSSKETGNGWPAMRMETIADAKNLQAAFAAVAKNKGAPGPDRQSIEQVQADLGRLLPKVRAELLNGQYEPGKIRRVWIPKAGGKRGLGIPNVIDRWVQEAVRCVLDPHLDAGFHNSSHGFRPGRSCHSAIADAKAHIEAGNQYVVDLDLEQFFDRIDHQRLLARLGRRIADRRVVKLVGKMLKAKVVLPEGVIVSTEEGAPQGGPLSPLLSNVVLDELDQELARRGHRFVRYADDCNIYVRSERAGQRVMASIVGFIERRMRLKVNREKSAVGKPEERHFVGFTLRTTKSQAVEVRLSERSRTRINERIRELTPRNWGQSLTACIKRLNEYLRGWMGFFWICSAEECRNFAAISAHSRRRLRAIILRQWKRRRTMAKRLIALGIRAKTAWRQIYQGRRRIWALSHCPAVDRALNNAYFAEAGLIHLPNDWVLRQPQPIVTAPERQLCLALG